MKSVPNKDRLVTVFGGSGFVGRHVVRALARQGYRVRIAVRRPDLAGHLQPMGAVGQIHAVQANIRDRASIERAIAGSFAVINLVGILFETGRQKFDAVQAAGAGVVAEAAAAAGVAHFVHQSAIGADAQSSSAYGRSKAEGEANVLRKAFSASTDHGACWPSKSCKSQLRTPHSMRFQRYSVPVRVRAMDS